MGCEYVFVCEFALFKCSSFTSDWEGMGLLAAVLRGRLGWLGARFQVATSTPPHATPTPSHPRRVRRTAAQVSADTVVRHVLRRVEMSFSGAVASQIVAYIALFLWALIHALTPMLFRALSTITVELTAREVRRGVGVCACARVRLCASGGCQYPQIGRPVCFLLGANVFAFPRFGWDDDHLAGCLVILFVPVSQFIPSLFCTSCVTPHDRRGF